MKIKIKLKNEDTPGFKRNKTLMIFVIILGILLTLLGLSGIIIDFFFPAISVSYHSVTGESNWPRFLLGLFFIFTYIVIKRSKDLNK